MARVLIVEDEEAEWNILGAFLERMGHQVWFASSGQEAFKLYAKGGIEIVVTDLQMPDGDGLELIEALGASFPEAKIIAVSGMGAEPLAAARSKGAIAVFSKPVDPEKFLGAIEKAVPGADES